MSARWLLVTVTAFSVLLGARAAGGPAPESGVAATGVREPGAFRNSFWRPAGSDAERPALRLEPVAWTPRAAS
jgi:hypothetical protein